MIGAIAIIVALAAGAILMSPLLRRSDLWRATATPLASTVGSGFLISLPILRDLVGAWAIGAMAVLLVVAYLIGAAIRENIAHVEPLLKDDHTPRHLASVERLSDLVLTFAYFVSVSFYLVLFGNFLLKPLALNDPLIVKLLVTLCLAVIGGVGLLRGFKAVERLEIYAVSINLGVIAGLFAGLVAFNVSDLVSGTLTTTPGHFDFHDLPLMAGLLIVVQGFETSRFLGATYGPDLRIRSMRLAQFLAAGIYLAFFALMVPLLGVASNSHSVAAIIDMLKPVSVALPALIVVGALASQSSASIADTLSAGGLLHGFGGGRITIRHAYPLIAFVAAAITWSTDVYELITLASRCFALFYALQCIVATFSADRRGRGTLAIGYAGLAAAASAIAAFGTPAGA